MSASSPAEPTAVTTNNYKITPQLSSLREEKIGLIREVGAHAVWSLSSCKSGYGVDHLRDNNLETYWQSDGPQPHLVNIQFRRKTTIKVVCMYVDYKLDESYTPHKISIRTGNHFQDLQEVELVVTEQPLGWIVISLKDANDAPIRAFHIQIAVLANHSQGRDTHLRQVKIYSPVNNAPVSVVDDMLHDFTTVALSQHTTLR